MGMDCYLEATNEKNKAFYERFGYVAKASSTFHKPAEWGMDHIDTADSVTDYRLNHPTSISRVS